LEHGTTRLLGLEGLAVVRVDLDDDDGGRVVHVVTADPHAVACPACGMVSTSVKQRTQHAPKDLPYGPAAVKLVWHKRRWRCRTVDCPRQTFAETVSGGAGTGPYHHTVAGGGGRGGRGEPGAWPRWPARTGCRGRRCSGR